MKLGVKVNIFLSQHLILYLSASTWRREQIGFYLKIGMSVGISLA